MPAVRPSGTRVSYAASAIDAVDGAVAVACVPASGSRFAITVTTVECTARDGKERRDRPLHRHCDSAGRGRRNDRQRVRRPRG